MKVQAALVLLVLVLIPKTVLSMTLDCTLEEVKDINLSQKNPRNTELTSIFGGDTFSVDVLENRISGFSNIEGQRWHSGYSSLHIWKGIYINILVSSSNKYRTGSLIIGTVRGRDPDFRFVTGKDVVYLGSCKKSPNKETNKKAVKSPFF